MTNYVFSISAKVVRQANLLRQAGTPDLEAAYFSRLLNQAGVNATDISVQRIIDNISGYKNFYYSVEATVANERRRYFGSMPDRRIEPLEWTYCHLAGFKYRNPVERKGKDFRDLRKLAANGIPATDPIAFDPQRGFVLEPFYDGVAMQTFFESNDYFEDTKLEKFAQGLVILKEAHEMGVECGEAFPENFLVKKDGQAILTDAERESASRTPEKHELAAFVYSSARSLRPEAIIRRTRELYPVETLRGLPRYNMRLFLNVDPLTLHRTNEAIKEV